MRHAGPTQTDLKSALEEMRVSVAGAGARTGLAGMVQDAFLKILEVLMALLMDFRAGNLAPPVATADAAPDAGAACAEDGDAGANASGAACTRTRLLSPFAGEGACGANGAAAHPSPNFGPLHMPKP